MCIVSHKPESFTVQTESPFALYDNYSELKLDQVSFDSF